MVEYNNDSNSNSILNESSNYYLKLVGIFIIYPLLIGIVSGHTLLIILPAFVILFLIETFQSHRNLLWSATILLVPIVSYAISAQLDPTVPQFTLLMLSISTLIVSLEGYAVLVGCYWLIQNHSFTIQWSVLISVGLILGIEAFDYNANLLSNYNFEEPKSLRTVAIDDLPINNTGDILVGSMPGAGFTLQDAHENTMRRDTTIVVTNITTISTNESYNGLALARANEAIKIYGRNGNHLHSIVPVNSTGDKQPKPLKSNFKSILICCSDEPKIS